MTEQWEAWLSYPEPMTWGEAEQETLFSLFIESKRLIEEEEEVKLVYDMGAPEQGSDDPIENMLESECYRLVFEEENPLFLEMKDNQKAYAKKIESFSRGSLLFLSFTLVERRETLCDTHELFKRYESWEALQEQFEAIYDKLQKLGKMHMVQPYQLGETLRSVI